MKAKYTEGSERNKAHKGVLKRTNNKAGEVTFGKEMKLIQVNEGQKCPKCGKYTIVQSHGYQYIANDLVIMWNYHCTNCYAKFVEEDLKGGQNE